MFNETEGIIVGVLSALISLRLTDEVEVHADAWHRLSVTRTSGLFEQVDERMRRYITGVVGEPSEGGRVQRWHDAVRAPSELGLSFGSDLNYHEGRFVALPGTAETRGAVRTLINVSLDGAYLLLSCEVVAFDEIVGAQTVAESLRDLVVDFSAIFPVDFGNVAPDNSGSLTRTSLEVALRRREETGLRQAQEALRGYSWTTVVPASLVPFVLRQLQHEHQIQASELPTGALVIQATKDIGGYDATVWSRLFECLAPVLPGGTPRMRRPATGLQPKLLDTRDARDVAPFCAS